MTVVAALTGLGIAGVSGLAVWAGTAADAGNLRDGGRGGLPMIRAYGAPGGVDGGALPVPCQGADVVPGQRER